MGEATKIGRNVGVISYVGMHNNLGAVTSANEANVQSIIPVAGAVTRLTIQLVDAAGVPAAGGAGNATTKAYTFTVRKSTGGGAFADTAVVCTITGAAASPPNTCTAVTTLSASFLAGDFLTIQVKSTGSANADDNLFVRWSAAFSAN